MKPSKLKNLNQISKNFDYSNKVIIKQTNLNDTFSGTGVYITGDNILGERNNLQFYMNNYRFEGESLHYSDDLDSLKLMMDF